MSYFLQQSFIGGIWGKIRSQLSRERRRYALSRCENFIITPQGSITRRPGTQIAFIVRGKSGEGFVHVTRVIRVNHRDIGDWTLMLGDGAFWGVSLELHF